MTISLEELMSMTEKVFIGLAAGEHARYTDFWLNFQNVLTPPNTARFGLMGIYIANLQNELARMFLATDCEYFWLVNDDQLYPQETLIKLLAHKKDVVVPLCLEKKAPHAPLIYGPADATEHFAYRYLRKGEKGLVQIGAAAGGGMLIKRAVFESIPDPWWEVHTVHVEANRHEQTSEDFDFCTKAAEAGYDLWCDLDVSVIHQAIYGLRAMRDPSTGEWRTVLMRSPDEKIVIPAATPPLNIDRRILVPDMKFYLE